MSRSEKILKLADWMVGGARPSKLQSLAAKEGWPDTADDIVAMAAEARKLISGDALIDRPSARKLAIVRLELCFYASTRLGDFKTALAAQRELIRLLKLDGKDLGAEPIEPEAQANDESLAAILKFGSG